MNGISGQKDEQGILKGGVKGLEQRMGHEES